MILHRLMELGQPGLHPLFVKAAITLACDRKERERELVSSLLVELHPAVITPDQVRGWWRWEVEVAGVEIVCVGEHERGEEGEELVST
jgi:hypothetical protein